MEILLGLKVEILCLVLAALIRKTLQILLGVLLQMPEGMAQVERQHTLVHLDQVLTAL
jgi:hypothetical protein